MPTNLGVLPSGLPIPNGRAQIKRGGADAGITMNSSSANQVLSDGAGGNMLIRYTPVYPCWWVVRGNLMTHGLDVGWGRCDFGITISPADAEGVTMGHQCCMQTYPSGTVEWRTWSGSYMFKLAAGVFYTAALTWASSTGGYNMQFHSGPAWCRITGRVVGEGVL